MIQRILATLLHVANTNPGVSTRDDFYSLKGRLLKRYAKHVGTDTQEITHSCWGWYYGNGCTKDAKCKCRGTGIYSRFWVLLDRYEWCGYVFHTPKGRTLFHTGPPPTIVGLVEHRDYGKLASEAKLWLFLLCGEWRVLWHALTASAHCQWSWHPFLCVQRIVFLAREYMPERRECSCGRRFWTWRHDWRCWRCEERMRRDGEYPDEIPF